VEAEASGQRATPASGQSFGPEYQWKRNEAGRLNLIPSDYVCFNPSNFHYYLKVYYT
jgi:hypothetical protein